MSEGNLASYELNSDGSYDESNPPPPKETPFQKQIKQKKKQLGKNYGHNAFYYQYSSAIDFINMKRTDPEARLFFPGSYVWVADKEKLYEPAKVISSIAYSEVALKAKRKAAKKGQSKPKRGDISNVRKLIKTTNSGPIQDKPKEDVLGQVVVQDGENLVILNVNAKAAKHLIPMRPEHLNPSNRLDVNIDDLSAASIMYNLRYQFDTMDESCLLIGNNTLVCLNRFLTREQEYLRAFDKMNKDTDQDEPPLNIKTFAETIFHRLNAKGGAEPQSCVITGNKHSNRRTVTKEFTTKIAQLSQAKDADWFGKLTAADEILSVFGGENFLRWTELHMKYKALAEEEETDEQQGKLIGAAFQSFLLDTSNLVNKDTNSFNVFHQICKAANHSLKQKRIEERKKAAEAQASPKRMTWREKQETMKREKLGLQESPKRKASRARKTVDELDFVNDLVDIFKFQDEDKYFYLNKGVLPQYRFTPEEIQDYFEDPEVKRMKLEAKRKAKEEKLRQEREKREAEAKALALAKEKEAEELELKRQQDEMERRKRAMEAKKNKNKPRIDVTTIGRADKNKYLESMAKTNVKHQKNKKLCTKEGCTSNRMGTELLCTKHFFEQSKRQSSTATVVAIGKDSGAASERRTSKMTAAEKAQATIKRSNFQLVVDTVQEEEKNRQTTGEVVEEEAKAVESEEEDLDEQESEPSVEVDDSEPWSNTLDNLRTLNVRNAEIASMINILRDILELGNILVCNTERKDGKKKLVEVVETISDDEKDEELVEKKIDAEEIYSPTPKQPTMRKSKLKRGNTVDEDGRKAIKDVAVDFLVEKKLVRKSLFGVKLLDLVTILNVRKLKIGNEEYLKPLGRNKCLARRDALVRALYAGMFNWLLSVINRGVSFTAEAAKKPKGGNQDVVDQIGIIAILEAVGLVTELDRLNSNSLEQLINNYGQEKLHSFQTIHILEEHAKIYKDNGLAVPFTPGNELVLPLILGQTKFFEEGIKEQNRRFRQNNRASFTRTFAAMNSKVREGPKGPQNKYQRNKKTLGILDICEEQFRAPKGNDKNLIERIMKEHKLHQNMLISKSRYAFKIQHFGAKVNYHVKGFVKKAWSSVLDDEVREFMTNNTKDKLVKKLLTEHSTARQQKRMEKIYNSGMQQIKLGLAVEQLQNEKELAAMESEGPLILSRHSVNINNSRLKREDLVTPNIKSKPSRKNRSSVSRGLTGMTMTLNLAGITRARNANNSGKTNAKQSPSMQSMPLSASKSVSSTQSIVYSGATQKRRGKDNAKATTSDGVRTVFNTMKTLIVMLDLTEPHFVHCIPTNEEQVPDKLDVMYTYEQLKIAGIIPFFAHRFKESSFGTGFTFKDFKQQFYPLNFIVKPENRDNPQNFMKNIQDLGAIQRDNWLINKNQDKIFLKLGSIADIETLSDTSFQDIVIFIQKYWRMGLTRKLYFILLQEKYERQIEKGNIENDLKLLTSVVGKAAFFKVKPDNLYLAQGKIKRLRAELKLKKKLEKVTAEGTIHQVYAVLNEAKDAHLPRCPEFIAAYEKYKKLDAAANAQHEETKKEREEKFNPILEEMENRRIEEEEWKEKGEKEFMKEIEELMKQVEQEKAKEQSTKPSKLDKYFDDQMRNSRKEEGTKNKRNRHTVRFGTYKDIQDQAKANGLDNMALVDDADSVDLDHEIDDAHKNPYASGRADSIGGSSFHSGAAGSLEDWQENGKQVNKGGLKTTLRRFNDMVKGKKSRSREGAPRRSSSFFNIFSKREKNEGNVGAPTRTRKKFGFTLRGFFKKFKKAKSQDRNSAEKSGEEDDIRENLGATQKLSKTRNESWELMSDDSIIRVDVEGEDTAPKPKKTFFGRLQGSYRSVRSSIHGSFRMNSVRESKVEEII